MKDKKNHRMDLLNRLFEGNVSNEEEQSAQDLFLDPELEFEIKETMRVHLEELSKSSSIQLPDTTAKARVLENIKHKMDDKKVFSIRKSIVRISKIAALIIFIFMLGGALSYVMFNMQERNVDYCIMNSPLGSKSELTLPDGTKISLNAGSTLRYPVNFMKGTREVFLDGEAYFNVTKMKDRLFVVMTSDVKIKVFGTQFNVKSYPDENQIQTTLVEGSLSVEPIRGKTKNSTVFLKPNQSVTFLKQAIDKTSNKVLTDKELTKVSKQPSRIVLTPLVDPQPIISWKDSKWVIVGEELDQLALKLERRYNVNITFSNESLKHYRFSGTLKSQTFEQVLKIIQESAPIQYTIENNNVIFREDHAYKKKYDTMINNPD